MIRGATATTTNRLMGTQNNAKGGYGYGGDANNKAAHVKYMAGSEVSTMWTAQHTQDDTVTGMRLT